MTRYIISFLGTAASDRYYEYTYQGQSGKGRVFPEALRDLVKFEKMLVCTTDGARETTWKIVESLNDSRIKEVPIKDGMDNVELWHNFEQIVSRFSQDDEVIFDITHGLRSLPFLVFIFSAYLKVAKKVTIASVLYGVLEKKRESEDPNIFGIIPVIELTEFVPMLDWMSATQIFVDLGDGNGLAKLLRNVHVADSDLKLLVDETASAIERVSDALIYIRPMEVMESVAELKELIPKIKTQGQKLPQLQPFLLLCKQIDDRYKSLALAEPLAPNHLEQNLQCQLDMMTWYQDHQQQVKSIMLGRELFVSILMYRQGKTEIFDYNKRKPTEKILNCKECTEKCTEKCAEFNQFTDSQKIKDTWGKATKMRNYFAHATMTNLPNILKVDSKKNQNLKPSNNSEKEPSITEVKKEIDKVLAEIEICLKKFLRPASD
jgi:CRISPR-associated DxTHG motif protein